MKNISVRSYIYWNSKLFAIQIKIYTFKDIYNYMYLIDVPIWRKFNSIEIKKEIWTRT